MEVRDIHHRKTDRYEIYTGVTQNVSDLVKGMKSSATDDQTENIFSNSKFFLLLSQSTPDRKVLEENLPIFPR